MKESDDHPMRFPRRQVGRTAEMKALIENAKADGKTVLVIGKDSPRPELLGAAMPPVGDPELDAVDEFREANPGFLTNEICWKSSKTAFDPSKLHWYLSDEAGMSKDFNADLEALRLIVAPKHLLPSYGAWHLHLHKYLEEGSVKDPGAREKKTKHNPKPSRMAFLDGLGPNKKY